ncbi:DUF721 domain-containing protein [Methylophaga sp. SB9B]|uniref:DciA family protein n=1 Tax=Methylophaga sp. SB9B TaxID=2570356 RepID=UPI0010A908F3|nr:DUF721 domain-containing protein [Methylophaga sp. SB9B]
MLPSQFSGHCQLANLNDNKIIIHTESAAIASLLRFHSATICKTLSNQLAVNIDRVEVKVKPGNLPRNHQDPTRLICPITMQR